MFWISGPPEPLSSHILRRIYNGTAPSFVISLMHMLDRIDGVCNPGRKSEVSVILGGTMTVVLCRVGIVGFVGRRAGTM
ncbi:unnamed protein product [Calypogeia fissa]